MGKKWLLLAGCAALCCSMVRAQVAPAAVGGERHLWVGGEYSNFAPDWGSTRLPGITVYFDIGVYRRYGLEGEVGFLNFTKPAGLTEKSVLGGPYATVFRRGKLSADVKFLAGAGLVTYTNDIGYGSYFEFAPAGDLEYRLSHRLKARFEYEYQFMPAAPGLPPPIPDHGLTPRGFSLGVAYHIF